MTEAVHYRGQPLGNKPVVCTHFERINQRRGTINLI